MLNFKDDSADMKSSKDTRIQSADEWMSIFCSKAKSFPECIVISDMTLPDAPMIFVNTGCATYIYF